ncbi:hypothetical protein PAXRUDRAFT_87802, partial [Paxillus rubicundulus Ve08.2h10]
VLCFNWQHPNGCDSVLHSSKHECSSCRRLNCALEAQRNRTLTPYSHSSWLHVLSVTG